MVYLFLHTKVLWLSHEFIQRYSLCNGQICNIVKIKYKSESTFASRGCGSKKTARLQRRGLKFDLSHTVSRCFCRGKRGRKKRRRFLLWATLNLHQTIRVLIRRTRFSSNARSGRKRAYNISRFLILLLHERDTSEKRIIFDFANLSLSVNLQRGFCNANFYTGKNTIKYKTKISILKT